MIKAVEAVTEGQADKICDQIADTLVDEFLRRDKNSRVNINVSGGEGLLLINGNIVSRADFDCAALARKVYAEIGYKDALEVFVNLNVKKEYAHATAPFVGSTVVTGYATNETRERLPKAVAYAQRIVRCIDELRKNDPAFFWLGPDSKIQIIMNGKELTHIILNAQHLQDISKTQIQTQLLNRVIAPNIDNESIKILINPNGQFTTGGFSAGVGATGRKANVDFYGGLVPQSFGALSGKDPFVPDRAGSYMTRAVAKHLVDSGATTSVLVSAAYSQSNGTPTFIQAIGAGGADLTDLIKKDFDFRPEAIVERLDLARPIYRQTSVYGHFGRDYFPWEQEI